MSGFNLPPGCNVSDIPGNSEEDGKFETLCDTICSSDLDADTCYLIWNMGLAAYKKMVQGGFIPVNKAEYDLDQRSLDNLEAELETLKDELYKRRLP